VENQQQQQQMLLLNQHGCLQKKKSKTPETDASVQGAHTCKAG